MNDPAAELGAENEGQQSVTGTTVGDAKTYLLHRGGIPGCHTSSLGMCSSNLFSHRILAD
jgi:hypothetical protein